MTSGFDGFDEEALRRLVREAIGRVDPQVPQNAAPISQTLTSHASHYRYALQPSDGPCVIEPGVRCNHCGYCESHGH